MSTWAKIIALILMGAASFASGWVVHGWKTGSDQKAAAVSEADAAKGQVADIIKASNALVDSVKASDKQTKESLARLAARMGSQAHAFTSIQEQLRTADFGNCRTTPASDRLLRDSYEAAGFGSAGSAAQGQAGNGDAAHRAATPAAAGQHDGPQAAGH